MLPFFRSIESLGKFRSIRSIMTIALLPVGFYTIYLSQAFIPVRAGNLPLDQDIPEEVLRAEIITEARSPIDGRALSAADFAELVVITKEKLDRDTAISAMSGSKLKETLLLLRLRGFLRSVGIPIK